MLELSNLCHCVQHPWKLTSRDFWSSRNDRKPLSKLKHVLRKCSGVWNEMLELSNLCHCVQHPWKLTSRDFWSSIYKLKHVNARAFEIVFSTPEILLVGISGVLGTKESHFLSKTWIEKMQWNLRPQWMLELSNLCHCVQHPWKLSSRDFWSSRMTESHFLSKNVFWENAVGYLRNGEY